MKSVPLDKYTIAIALGKGGGLPVTMEDATLRKAVRAAGEIHRASIGDQSCYTKKAVTQVLMPTRQVPYHHRTTASCLGVRVKQQ